MGFSSVQDFPSLPCLGELASGPPPWPMPSPPVLSFTPKYLTSGSPGLGSTLSASMLFNTAFTICETWSSLPSGALFHIYLSTLEPCQHASNSLGAGPSPQHSWDAMMLAPHCLLEIFPAWMDHSSFPIVPLEVIVSTTQFNMQSYMFTVFCFKCISLTSLT